MGSDWCDQLDAINDSRVVLKINIVIYNVIV